VVNRRKFLLGCSAIGLSLTIGRSLLETAALLDTSGLEYVIKEARKGGEYIIVPSYVYDRAEKELINYNKNKFGGSFLYMKRSLADLNIEHFLVKGIPVIRRQ